MIFFQQSVKVPRESPQFLQIPAESLNATKRSTEVIQRQIDVKLISQIELILVIST